MLKYTTNLYSRPSWNQRTKYQEVVKRFFAPSSPANKTEGLLGSSVVVTSVFPDDTASAAGVRTRFLLERLGQHARTTHGSFTFTNQQKNAADRGGSVILTTTDKEWNQLSSSTSTTGQQRVPMEQEYQQWIPNLMVEHLPMNRSHAVENFLLKHNTDKGIERIIFDRFYVEEAFSHAFWEGTSSALDNHKKPAMVLDMQDMHSLRHGRQEVVQKLDRAFGKERGREYDPLKHVIPEVMAYAPKVNGPGKDSDRLLRELASIHRCDMTLVCSPYEMDLLQREYGIPRDKLCLASFFVDHPSSIVGTSTVVDNGEAPKEHEETKFVFCGGFRHDPNVDAVQVLLKHVWPKLLSMSGRNILLAPLRFGAGIKGKILDAWMNGMPAITTPIGSEGIVQNKDDFGGAVCSTVHDFCESAIALMTNSDGCYSKAQTRGFHLLRKEFDKERNWDLLHQQLQSLQSDLTKRRQRDPVQALLWHQSLRSTKYFSKWIEEKETK
ncbi:unnamed protein product [Cylindrotheca closterium]|uniref:Glycosyltransferase n=1 Tax=Cylindrotheca closterium TaxID=2856 RepID=A0AAD2JGY6_9STRA|nr:unnamed protein product [Cylindrotheca closterium]